MAFESGDRLPTQKKTADRWLWYGRNLAQLDKPTNTMPFRADGQFPARNAFGGGGPNSVAFQNQSSR